jgi:hypothetical protein
MEGLSHPHRHGWRSPDRTPAWAGETTGWCYTRERGESIRPVWRFAISEALRNAWSRLTRKQLLFAYPLTLGVVNTVAFLAVYAALEGRLTFTDFAEANFTNSMFMQSHLRDLLHDPMALVVAVVAAVAVSALAAAVRAPFFRAIAGTSYPLAPRSVAEFVRLTGFYAITGVFFYLLPVSVDPGSSASKALPLVILPVAVLIIFADYALVFESLDPITAIRRSIRLLRRGWNVAIVISLAAWLLGIGAFSLFNAYYANATAIFPLFVASQLLVEALITTILDVVLIFTYDHLRRL